MFYTLFSPFNSLNFLKFHLNSVYPRLKQTLQNDLNNVGQWLQENKLVLNQSKTKWMLFGTRQKLEHSSDIVIQSHWQNIDRVSNFCYLGVTLDEHLSWNEHVEIICNKVSKRLRTPVPHTTLPYSKSC